MNITASSNVVKIHRSHKRARLPLVYALMFWTLMVSCWSSTTSDIPTMGEPIRPLRVVTGSKFIQSTFKLNEQQREDVIFDEARAGNIPSRSRTLVPIQLNAISPSGKPLQGTIYVTADYFAIGNDADNLRIPMNPITAQKIANSMNMSLPTTKIVDLIYRQATVRLDPRPLPANPKMTSSEYYLVHDAMIDRQMASKSAGVLVAGHKKDVVISNRLQKTPGKVAIYGWHRSNGIPIQPLSLVHHNLYADYSHGIRFVHNYMIVNGKKVHYGTVLADPELAPLVSDEGPIRRYQIQIPMINNASTGS